MAVSNEDLARLVVSLEATTTKYYNALRKAQQQTNSSASSIERRLTSMATNIDRTFANLGRRLADNLTGPLAGIGAAFSVREVLRYADAWTEAGNQLAASSDITGIQARSLSELRKVADDSRAGFEETVKLYSRIQRSAGDVAKSEEDIARATGIVNKAFKAGGAATSEFNAGILQLSQGLGSGVLQGDELRSVRENAPVLAKVIADYFGVTIAGLKELGSEGKLTSEEVFKAILAGESQIESAFGTTQATIADGFTKVRNALVEYVGSSDQSLGATRALNAGLNALAENFNSFADAALKVAALIAGALVGRSLVALIGSVTAAGATITTLITAMRAASVAGASFSTVLTAAGVAAGPIAAVIGGVALLAIQHFTSQAAATAQQLQETNALLNEMGISGSRSGEGISEAAAKLRELAEANDQYAASERRRQNDQVRGEIDYLNTGVGPLGVLGKANEDLETLGQAALRARSEVSGIFNSAETREGYQQLLELINNFRSRVIDIEELGTGLADVIANGATKEVATLAERIFEIANDINRREIFLRINADTKPIDDAREALIDAIELQRDLAGIRQEFAIQQDLDNLITKLQDTDTTAEEVREELIRIATANVDSPFGNFINGLNTLIDKFGQAIAAARTLESYGTISGGSADLANRPRGQVGQIMRERREREAAQAQYISDQREFNALSQEERNIREEIDRIVRSAKKDGTTLSAQSDAVRQLAIENLALKESDRASTRSGKQSGRDAEKFAETIAEQERSNELLRQELELRAGLNPLIEDYGYAIERWKKQQELLNAAEDAGIALTPDLENKIGLIAEAYASGTAALEKLQETQDKAKESLQEWLDLAKSATRSFIDDLIEGKSAAEALSNVLSQLGSHLIDLGLNTLFGGGGGGGGLGILGQLFGGFGGFRASGGPVSRGQAYVVGEKRPEVFVPQENGVIIPRVPNGIGGGGGVSAPFQINIDATGADREGLMRVQQELVNLRAQVPYLVRSQVSKRTSKGW